jgi:hypothetical protein
MLLSERVAGNGQADEASGQATPLFVITLRGTGVSPDSAGYEPTNKLKVSRKFTPGQKYFDFKLLQTFLATRPGRKTRYRPPWSEKSINPSGTNRSKGTKGTPPLTNLCNHNTDLHASIAVLRNTIAIQRRIFPARPGAARSCPRAKAAPVRLTS